MEYLIIFISLIAIPVIWGYRKLAAFIGFSCLAYATKAGWLNVMFSATPEGTTESLVRMMVPVALMMSLGMFAIIRFMQVSR